MYTLLYLFITDQVIRKSPEELLNQVFLRHQKLKDKADSLELASMVASDGPASKEGCSGCNLSMGTQSDCSFSDSIVARSESGNTGISDNGSDLFEILASNNVEVCFNNDDVILAKQAQAYIEKYISPIFEKSAAQTSPRHANSDILVFFEFFFFQEVTELTEYALRCSPVFVYTQAILLDLLNTVGSNRLVSGIMHDIKATSEWFDDFCSPYYFSFKKPYDAILVAEDLQGMLTLSNDQQQSFRFEYQRLIASALGVQYRQEISPQEMMLEFFDFFRKQGISQRVANIAMLLFSQLRYGEKEKSYGLISNATEQILAALRKVTGLLSGAASYYMPTGDGEARRRSSGLCDPKIEVKEGMQSPSVVLTFHKDLFFSEPVATTYSNALPEVSLSFRIEIMGVRRRYWQNKLQLKMQCQITPWSLAAKSVIAGSKMFSLTNPNKLIFINVKTLLAKDAPLLVRTAATDIAAESVSYGSVIQDGRRHSLRLGAKRRSASAAADGGTHGHGAPTAEAQTQQGILQSEGSFIDARGRRRSSRIAQQEASESETNRHWNSRVSITGYSGLLMQNLFPFAAASSSDVVTKIKPNGQVLLRAASVSGLLKQKNANSSLEDNLGGGFEMPEVGRKRHSDVLLEQLRIDVGDDKCDGVASGQRLPSFAEMRWRPEGPLSTKKKRVGPGSHNNVESVAEAIRPKA